ncbi:MAG: FKBP-type peptidyl-prolyl cis-trans isomerase [Bacteroidota bacterium]
MPFRFSRALTLCVCTAALAFFAGCQPSVADFSDVEERPLDEQVAYIVGFSQGEGIRQQFIADSTLDVGLDPALLLAAYRAGLDGDTMLVSQQRAQEIFTAFQDTVMARASRKQLAEADSFLTANAARDSVSVTESGLQYQVLASGEGDSPVMGDRVTVHYTGTLINGTVFDSSYNRGEPTEFVIGEVVPGWNEALSLMQVGDRWRLFIPPDLGYGANPNPRGPIPPNAVLIFELELLGFESVEG